MNDQIDNTSVEQNAVEQTTQTNSPNVEGAPTESQTPNAEVVPQETQEVAPDNVESSMTEEQRRAFQEQRLEIKRLKEESEARVKTESAFDAFRPKQVPSVELNQNQFIDPVTGDFDWSRYNQQVVANANQVAGVQANQVVNEKLDEYQARNQFPEVFANPEAEQETADLWVAAKLRGENVSISDIAKKVANRFSKTVSKAEKVGAEKVLNELTPKEQASLSAQSNNGTQSVASDNSDASRLKVRMGDDNELARLMSKVK